MGMVFVPQLQGPKARFSSEVMEAACTDLATSDVHIVSMPAQPLVQQGLLHPAGLANRRLPTHTTTGRALHPTAACMLLMLIPQQAKGRLRQWKGKLQLMDTVAMQHTECENEVRRLDRPHPKCEQLHVTMDSPCTNAIDHV